MFRGGIPIGRLFGISLRLNFSWFIIFGLVTWALAASYFPLTFGWPLPKSIAAGVLTSLLFFGSVLAHELMHSVVALGQGTPVRSITLFIFGGVSEIKEEPKKPLHELRMAIAGPLTSLALAGIFYGIHVWATNRADFVAGVTFWLGITNLFLGIFNLIPGFPLDGGRVLRSILWWQSHDLRRATKTASNVGRGVGFLFIFGGIWIIFTTGSWFNGLWLALIGWFLENAAVGSYRQVALHDVLQGHTASEVMTRECPTIPPRLTIQQLVDELILTSGRRCFPVVSDSRAVGLVTLSDVRKIPRDLWKARTVSETMTPLDKMITVTPQQDLASVLQILTDHDINQVPVVQDGNIVGMVGRDNLLSFVTIRAELGV